MTPAAQQALQPLDIFQLLGYTGTDENEQNQILEEAQLLLLQDLVEKDLPSRLSAEDMASVQQLMADESKPMAQRQSDLLTMISGKIDDLDAILLDKTAQMKLDVLQERLADMKQQFAQDAYSSQQLAQAELWLNRGDYLQAVRIMNTTQARVPQT